MDISTGYEEIPEAQEIANREEENSYTEIDPSRPTSPAENHRQQKSIISWFKEYQLYQIALIYMTTRLFVNLSQAYIPLYLQVDEKLSKKNEKFEK